MMLKSSLNKLHYITKLFQYKYSVSVSMNNKLFNKNNLNFKGLTSPKIVYRYSAVSVKDMKINYDPSKKTQIVSLNQQQLQQLASITTYMTSISFLQKNDLKKSLQYLNYALNQAKSNFPQSINLHMCILNRKSILLKLLSQNQQFVNTLEQIFLLGQSLKGLKHLQIQKHLHNYLLSLLFHNRQKMSYVIQYIQNLDQVKQSPRLQKKIKNFLFFDAIADLLIRNQSQKGLSKLQSLPQQTFQQKYFKTNNLASMKYINWKLTSKSESQFTKKVKQQGEQLLKVFLRTLFDMEYCVPQKSLEKNQATQPKNNHLTQLLKGYLVGNVKQLRFVPDHVKLGNPQSHIVTMNIANLLFDSQRLQQCVYFMKLSLSTALDLGQVERVGMSLLLLAKISFKGVQNYDQILLGILQNSNNYPSHIIKECLSLYSQVLFKQARYIQAQNYANQMIKLEGDTYLQGLLLPDYDFSY